MFEVDTLHGRLLYLTRLRNLFLPVGFLWCGTLPGTAPDAFTLHIVRNLSVLLWTLEGGL